MPSAVAVVVRDVFLNLLPAGLACQLLLAWAGGKTHDHTTNARQRQRFDPAVEVCHQFLHFYNRWCSKQRHLPFTLVLAGAAVAEGAPWTDAAAVLLGALHGVPRRDPGRHVHHRHHYHYRLVPHVVVPQL